MKRTLSTIVLVVLLVLTVVALKRINTTASVSSAGAETINQTARQ